MKTLSTRLGSPWIDNDIPYVRDSLSIRRKDWSCDKISELIVCFNLFAWIKVQFITLFMTSGKYNYNNDYNCTIYRRNAIQSYADHFCIIWWKEKCIVKNKNTGSSLTVVSFYHCTENTEYQSGPLEKDMIIIYVASEPSSFS